MKEIIGRLDGNPEECLAQPPQRRRLARLVGPVDQVQSRVAAGEVERNVGEWTEGVKGKLENLHEVAGNCTERTGNPSPIDHTTVASECHLVHIETTARLAFICL